MKDDLSRRLVELTRDLVLIPTSSSRPGNIERSVEFIKNHLEETEGITIQTYYSHGIPSITALPKNQTKPDVLLCAHLDVVSLPEDAHYKSHVENGRIYGPGAADMKGALAILLEIFRDIHARAPEASLGLIVTTDEERGGDYGVKFLFEEKGLRCGVAIIPDSGSLNEITVEEKGILHLAIRCHGPAGHACRPWIVDNPMDRLLDRLGQVKSFFNDMKKDGDDHWYSTFTVTIIRTENEAYNRIPAHVEAICDVRFTPPCTTEKMIEILKDKLGKDMELEVLISAETSQFSPDPLFISVTEEITGKPVKLCKAHGASDARFVTALGIPVIISRPMVGNIHSENEWIDIESMSTLYRIYEKYLMKKLVK
ncbi:MAG: M20 family metallopeptidase [Nitrospinota bacterium]